MMSGEREGTLFHFRNILIFLGILVTAVGIVYFAVEFVDRLSEWGRVASLALLTAIFVALGVGFESEEDSGELVAAPGLRWLRVTSALYVIGLTSAFTTVVVFLGIDDLDPLVKLATTLVLGLGLILWAARRWPRKQDEGPL